MRHAPVVTIHPTEKQEKLGFSSSSPASRKHGTGGRQKLESKASSHAPLASKTPSSSSSPLSPNRQLRCPRKHSSTPTCPSPVAAASSKPVPVISLLSDDSDDSDVEVLPMETWPSALPTTARSFAAPLAVPSHQTSSPSATNPNTSSVFRQPSLSGDGDEEGAEDVDQLSWSDEDGSSVPTYIQRARRAKVAKASRDRQKRQRSPSSPPKKRGRPPKAGRRTAAALARSSFVAPSADEERASTVSSAHGSRWRHC